MNEKTSVEKLASGQLEGLIIPEPPEPFLWWFWLLAGFLLVVFVLIVKAWLQKYHSPKAKASRELKHLKAQNINKTHAKDIAIALRHGLKLTRLDEYQPENKDWQKYLSKLETAIYANEPVKQDAALSLISSAQKWLQQS